MTAGSGDPSPQAGSLEGPLPPTGLPTASDSSRVQGSSGAKRPRKVEGSSRAPYSKRTARRRARRKSGHRLFAFDRALGVRLVAGADEAGRGCLAGPLVAAGVLFDYERLR